MAPIVLAPGAIPLQIDFTLEVGSILLVALFTILLVGAVFVLSAALTGDRGGMKHPRRVVALDPPSDRVKSSSFSPRRRSLAA